MAGSTLAAFHSETENATRMDSSSVALSDRLPVKGQRRLASVVQPK